MSNLLIGVPYYYRLFASNATDTIWSSASERFAIPPATRQLKFQFCGYEGNETLTNFPALVTLSTNIPGFDYADFQSSSGGDLRFYNADFSRGLRYEIDVWNPSGVSYIWVQVPELIDSNTCIYARYGHHETNLLPATQNGGTWSDGYSGVWHLETTNVPDSSPNAFESIGDTISNIFGQVGTAQRFERSNGRGHVDIEDISESEDQVFTFSAWVQSSTANAGYFLSEGHAGSATSVCGMAYSSGFLFILYRDVNQANANVTGSIPIADGQWHHVAAVADGTDIRLYVDGIEDASTPLPPMTNNVNIAGIGQLARFGTSFEFTGNIDEARIDSRARSSNWIHTVHWNIRNTTSSGVFVCSSPVDEINLVIDNEPGAEAGFGEATLNGRLKAGEPADVTIFWGDSDGGTNVSAWAQSVTLPGSPTGAISTVVSGLIFGVQYHYRLYMTNTGFESWASSSVVFKSTSGGDGGAESAFLYSDQKVGGSSILNQDGSETALEWATHTINSNAFAHDSGLNPHQLTVGSAGDYLVAFTLPMINNNNNVNNQRTTVRAIAYVNGVAQADLGAISESSYIRAADNQALHQHSSDHFATLLDNVPANATLEVRVRSTSANDNDLIMQRGSLYVE
ncbi:MAG: DUF2341 domain-containing protein, partial [Verrucomicrobiota bacterium]